MWERERNSNNFRTKLFFTFQARCVWNPGRALLKSRQVCGRLAQLGERIVRNDEAGGSNPLPSTKIPNKNDVFVGMDVLMGDGFD